MRLRMTPLQHKRFLAQRFRRRPHQGGPLGQPCVKTFASIPQDVNVSQMYGCCCFSNDDCATASVNPAPVIIWGVLGRAFKFAASEVGQ